MNQAEHKYLSVDAVEGVNDSTEIYLLGLESSIEWSTVDLYPDQEIEHMDDRNRLKQLNPLYAYTYNQSTAERHEVDYIFIRSLFSKIKYLNQTHHFNSFDMEKVGRAWWLGTPPIIQNRSYRYSLQQYIGNQLLTIHDDIDISTIASPEHLRLRFACRLFADHMTERIGIRCCIDAQNTATTLIFPDCPFCSDQLPGCRVLFGVVKSFISWLYHLPEGDILNISERQSLSIQAKARNHHAIVIDYSKRVSGRKGS